MLQIIVTGKIISVTEQETADKQQKRIWVEISERAWDGNQSFTRSWNVYISADNFSRYMGIVKKDRWVGVRAHIFEIYSSSQAVPGAFDLVLRVDEFFIL